ncbi:related to cell surface ferroxidase [Cephalotrichum gorgonifer]|uniref:Related to cell surface ferroxidase n=1 Tax=Cephalotrichum gorgonifer TaxID=2041049 RepID=A0AAE8SWG5_9PEZI|nr:related to cell surface ferroxidase [Cephalotrichum gorgonifer]
MGGLASLLIPLLLSPVIRLSQAATVSYNFNATWVTANPDGAFDRPTIGINGEWPIPRIEANIGDTILIDLYNGLGNQSTSLHFHGLFMNGSTHMDGPSFVSQCPIPPGSSFTYNFTIQQPGTYWYHSHTQSQYPDGLRGPLIIYDPDSPFKDQYDEELVMTLSDWYHDQMQDLIPPFMAKGNPTGAEPVPQAALMNETQGFKLSVEPGKTYLVRLVNIGAFAGQYVWFEGHNISIVEVDGVYTKPAEASMIYLSVAQRCSFLLTTKNDTSENFAITLFDALPPELNYNVTGWLVYDDKKSLPTPAIIDAFDPFDDMNLAPHDEQKLLPPPDRTVQLDVSMDNLGDGANYAFFNNITYKSPKVPSVYTVLSAGEQATDPRIYGEYTHPFVLGKDEIVQIVVNNLDSGRHPFHLHGHHFQAVYRGEESSGTFEDSGVKEEDLPAVPMRRDTLVVWPEGNIVLRFKADNAGVWLFHCHIEWHVTSGLIATFIEAPLEVQKTLTIPQNHLDVCSAGNVPVSGNAAANTEDFLDLSGQNEPPRPLPSGFTTGGIVAFVFSCIAGILGIAVVGWYEVLGEEAAADKAPHTSSGEGRTPGSA